jgi:rod shape-determining protein MreD
MMVFLLALLGVCLLQPTVVPRLAISGIQPDLFLILAFAVSLSTSTELATGAGFVVGLYQDTLSGAPLGLHAFTLSLVGFLVSRLRRQFRTAHLPARGILLLTAAIISGLSTLLLLRFFRILRPIVPSLVQTIMPGAFYTAILGLAVLALPRLNAIKGLRE